MVKRIVLAVGGTASLVLGITLVLAWWPSVVELFKGFIGMALALAGMILLYLAKE